MSGGKLASFNHEQATAALQHCPHRDAVIFISLVFIC